MILIITNIHFLSYIFYIVDENIIQISFIQGTLKKNVCKLRFSIYFLVEVT